jgi:heat shock protein HslJ
MKQLYVSILLLFSISVANSQSEQLEGVWVLDSIFDFDILLENPINQISIDFSGDTDRITIESFCGNIYESFFTPSATENSIDISQTSWDYNECSEDNQGWEPAIANLFANIDVNPKTLSYSITQDGENTFLEVDYSYLFLGVPSGTIGYFKKANVLSGQLLGEWYLSYIEVNNVTHYNVYNNESLFEMEITEDANNENLFIISGGSVCNSLGGEFTINQNDLIFNSLDFTLQDCAFTPGEIFEQIYYYDFLNNASLINPAGFGFSITGINDNETLTLTDPSTGNVGVYGRNPSPSILTQTWYLSRIEIPGNPTIEIPSTESPSITLTNDINPVTFKTIAYGEGECNAFMSDYEITLNNGDNIQLLDFSATLEDCESDYELEYFSILSNLSTNFSEFEITNNGTVLSLTDLLGVRLVFNDEPLSISENELNTLKISLKNNPVTSHINVLISQSERELKYQIYSIEGKLIKNAVLRSDTINVEELNSGLYFIRFTNIKNQQQTIKFVKQ